MRLDLATALSDNFSTRIRIPYESVPHTPHVYNRPPIDPQGQDSLAKIARRIQPGSLVLDVGCGVGTLGKYLSESLHCVVDGIDANHIELEAARPFYRHLWEWDLEREHLPRNLQKLRYDYIVCADILEHLREPGRLLQLPARPTNS
uniref:class I SAM-dependent methyltransferase n=1 Tax=Acidithiobacillus caldus TaxID=33059 RepID=UPI001459D6B9|nr:methyltransferase domain-containing protein [Acidithiobacillus caldus]